MSRLKAVLIFAGLYFGYLFGFALPLIGMLKL